MQMSTQLVLFSVLVFFACFLLFEAGILLWKEKHSSEAKKLATRLDNISNEHLYQKEISILRQRFQDNQSLAVRIVQWFVDLRKIDMVLMQSGKNWTVEQFGRYLLYFFIAGFLVALVFGLSVLLAALAGACAALLPIWHIFQERTKRLEKLEQQLPDAIESMARSLKAGHSFQSAFKIVGEEFNEPLAAEFRMTLEESNLGVPLNEAMLSLSKRVPITDLKFFVIAILIQRESGGNLANVLTSMGQIIRERFQLMREIRTLSAEGRTSGLVMWLMPVFIVPLMSLLAPYYSKLLFGTDTGLTLLKIGCVLMIIAGIVMRKIVQIKV